MMPRKYTGNTDGLSRTGARPGITKLIQIAQKNGFSNLGSFANRSMNNPKAKQGDPKWLSVHATGRACDIGYTDRAKALEMWDFLLANTAELGIEEIHDYAYDDNVQDKQLGWGRGYRCSRGEGAKGVKIYDSQDNAGSQGGKWLHVELSPEMADNVNKFTAAWKKCKGGAQA
jgi:hypothetical protein